MHTALLLLLAAGVALGQQETARKPKTETNLAESESTRAVQDFKSDAAAYVIRLTSRPKEKLKLHEESLFHWGNPARTGEDGAVFVWTLDGRPEVIGSVFTY